MINLSKKKIMGYWGGQPIYRNKTPEERLQEAGINPEVANLGFSLEVNHLIIKNNKNE